MSRANKTIANIYNPLNQDKETLLESFVIRKKEFARIFRDIKSGKLNQISQNFLIQGQRGSGKTTLLAKLRYEIENSNDLSHLLAVQFAEEQYNIFSLNRLWENVADILEDTEGFEKIACEMEKFDDDDDYYFLIEKYLNKNKKKLILLIDNFGDILDKLGEKEHKKLRDILHESDLQIIAASTRTLETAYKHDKPFFESFKTIYLEALTREDVRILLENLNKQYDDKKAFEIIKKQTGRIETIRRLTGGVPRTIILLYEIIIDDSANVFEDLEGILDKITPLYKHKMDDLSTQQQVIIDAIALHWDGMLPSEISKQTKLESKKISAQLKILEMNGFVFSTFINKKNKIYMLEERFFNIWYLMRYGRKKKKQQILWLVRFLRDWCTPDELKDRAKNHIALTANGELHQKGGYYMAEALSQTVQDDELKYQVLSSTKDFIGQSNPELADSLSDAGAMYNLALLYEDELKNSKKAELYYLQAIENDFQNHMDILITKFADIKNKTAFLNIFKKYHNKSNYISLFANAIAMIHVGKYKESVENFTLFLELTKDINNFQKHLTNYFILLISGKQYHLAMGLFQKELYQLKEKIKPVYYALMHLMKDDYPKEYVRMGSELNETVFEILETIKGFGQK